MCKLNEVNIQNAVLVGVGLKNIDGDEDINRSLVELEELAKSAGADVIGMITQNMQSINPSTYIGKGKTEELAEIVVNMEADLVIFDCELSGSQIRNLEYILGVQVIDRTALILDIFALRAKSNIAKLQVELAQLKYRLPRLSSIENGFSRTGAGIGTRGPGEQKLEIDRRRIRDRISDIQRRIKDAQKVRNTQYERRTKSEIPIVALAGYTNSGKSTFMNRCIFMSDKNADERHVFAKDMLFATLDTTSRRIEIMENRPFILIDTVGFVSKLPHDLVSAFKSTLDEILQADLILHVVDCSSGERDSQIETTIKVLNDLGACNIEQIIVNNKMDLIGNVHCSNSDYKSVYISAKTGMGLDDLIKLIESKIYNDCERINILIPFAEAGVYDKLCKCGKVYETQYINEGIKVDVELDNKNLAYYEKYKY